MSRRTTAAAHSAVWLLLLVVGAGLFVTAAGMAGYEAFQKRKQTLAAKFLVEAERALRQNRDDDVIRNLEASVALAPRNIDAYARLADAHRRKGAPQAAEDCLARMLAANPGNHYALVMRGRFELMSGRAEAAEGYVRDALAMAPTDRDALFLGVQTAAQRGQLPKVRELARRCLDSHPYFAEFYAVASDAELRAGNTAEAIDWLRRGVAVAPKHESMLWALGNLLVERSQFSAVSTYSRMLREIPGAAFRAAFLETRCNYAQGRWHAAGEGFRMLRPQLAGQPAMLEQVDAWLADCYRQIGDVEQQLAVFQQALKDNPTAMALQEGVVSSLLAMGRTNEALAEFNTLVKKRGAGAEAPLQQTRMQLVKALQQDAAKRSWKEVEKALAAAEKLKPRPPMLEIVKAEVLLAQDRPVDAERVLREGQRRHPKDLSLRLLLTALSARRRQWDEAFRWLDDTRSQLGDSAQLRLAKAATYVMQLGSGACQRLRRLGERTQKLPERELIPLWRGLALIAMRTGNIALAERFYRGVLLAVPNNSEGWRFLLELAIRKGDTQLVDKLLTQIQDAEGRGPHWQFGRAVLFRIRSEGKDAALLAKAQRHLAAAQSQRPSWPNIPFLAAEIDALLGNEASATGNYFQAIIRGKRDPQTVRQVMAFLWKHEHYFACDQVIRYLRRQQSGVLTELVQAGANVTLRLDDFAQALAPAEAAVRTGNFHDQLWLAQVLEVLAFTAAAEHRPADAKQSYERAEAMLRSLTSVHPQQPFAWTALVQFFARQDRRDAALSAIETAREKLPAETARLVAADALALLGDSPAAFKEFQELVRTTDNPRPLERCTMSFVQRGGSDQLDAFLTRVATDQVPATPAAAAWARRRRAWNMSQTGLAAGKTEALKLLEKNLQSPAATAEDRRMQVLVLASTGSAQSRPEAIRILQEMRREQNAYGPEEQFLLARLYLAGNEWENAAREMRNLLTYHGDEPRYLTTYVSALLQRRQLAEAESWLDWMETLVPEHFSTVALRAQSQFYRGRFDASAQMLQRFVDKHDAQPADRKSRLRLAADVLQELARGLRGTTHSDTTSLFSRPAEAMRRELLSEFPEQGIALAALLASDGRIDEAFRTAEKSWSAASADTLRDAAAVMLDASVTPAHTVRLEKLLRTALEQHKRAPPLLIALANVLSRQDRPRESIALLREVLERDDANVEAMRALAAQLAFQRLKLAEALKLVEKAITLSGASVALLDARATVYLAMSRPDKARADLEVILAQEQNPVVLYHYYRACSALEEKKIAAAALTKARNLGLRPELLHPLERRMLAALP